MKKNTIKAFTLVEMLIVIVIIGILIASLMPRMQTAQGRARDVARKNDLSQIQTAIITSQQDRGKWPGMSWDAAKGWIAISWDTNNIESDLKAAGMTQIPKDPNGSNEVSWLWSGSIEKWAYGYMVTNRNWVPDAWFALMAKTEVEWWSNWVVCSGSAQDGKIVNWIIGKGADLKDVQLCTQVSKGTCSNSGWTCSCAETSELRYLLVY